MAHRNRTASPVLLWALLAFLMAAAIFGFLRGGAEPPAPTPVSTPTPTPEPTPTPPAEIDASCADSEGRVWVRYTGTAQPPVKVQVLRTGEGETAYNYDLPADGTPIALPLTQGEGAYTVTVLEHIEEKRYRPVLTHSLTLALSDPKAPYLHPNRLVDYAGTAVPATAEELVGELDSRAARIDCLLTYVADKLVYDEEKAAAAAGGELAGYIPDLSSLLAGGKGICYDYAALLCALLRSQGIPCKLQVGWAGELYHAWVEVWSDEAGELSGGVMLNEGWTILDPTFLSTQGPTEKLAAYLAGEGNYRVRYTY